LSPVLLRVINSSSMSAYHLDLGALSGELIAVDGFRVHLVARQRFTIAVSQRLDVRIAIPHAPAAYPVLAILEGETGVILLAGRAQVTRVLELAPVPSPHSPSIWSVGCSPPSRWRRARRTASIRST
jgi:FtsP/CotA-like multicopper oxidase with cupredoxin domain